MTLSLEFSMKEKFCVISRLFIGLCVGLLAATATARDLITMTTAANDDSFRADLEKDIPAQNEAIVPNINFILQHALAYASTKEDQNLELFNTHYSYIRVRIWKRHNDAGELKDLKSKITEENTPPYNETKMALRGRDILLSAYPLTNIINRFEFTLIGEDKINGRSAYEVEFEPHPELPVNHLMDPLINRAAGTLWIDAEDFAIAKAQFHFVSPVKVAGGMIGQIRKFSCDFTRYRSAEECWFVHQINWHMESSFVALSRISDYHEERIHQKSLPQ
jgi:hypothetical protein